MNILQIFQKERAHENLTPGERALLKVFWSLVYKAIASGLLTAGAYLLMPDMIDPQRLAFLVITAVVYAFTDGVAKYIKAHGDPQLGNAIEVVEKAVEQRLPPQKVQSYETQRIPRFTSMPTLPDMPIVQPPRPPTQQL